VHPLPGSRHLLQHQRDNEIAFSDFDHTMIFVLKRCQPCIDAEVDCDLVTRVIVIRPDEDTVEVTPTEEQADMLRLFYLAHDIM
jgi:hypothetical protein